MALRPHSRAAVTLRRRFHRLPVIWSGRLEQPGAQTDCTILNVSPGGAKLQLSEAEPCPSRVTLHSPRFGQLRGRVVWHRHDQIGLSFVEEPAQVATAVGGLLGEPVFA